MTPADGVRSLLLFLAAAGLAPVAAAQAPDPAAQLQAANESVQQGDCTAALASLDAALPRLAGRPRLAAQLMRIGCLEQLGRRGEIASTYAELAAADPANPAVQSLGVFVAADANDFDTAAERLIGVAENHPNALSTVSGRLWRGIAQRLTEQGKTALRDRAVIALARVDWAPDDQPELNEGIVQGAIQALLKTQQHSEAEAMLERVRMPSLLVGMAAERLYAPLWPRIEAMLGPQGAIAVDRYAGETLDLLARMPDDTSARRDAIRAFIMLGRYEEAVELARPIAIADGIGEDAIASLRLEAQALAALGRAPEAIDRMRGLLALDPAKSPDAASGLVAFAELLDEQRRSAEALDAARRTLGGWGDALSAWGKAWLRRTEVCALHGLGRGDEERQAADALKADAAVNQAAAIEALLCAGRTDEAAAIAVAALGTVDGASELSDQFQPEEASWAPAHSRLRALWEPLLARPDVRTAFARNLRLLPRTLWPSRTPRPIPRSGSGDLPTT